MAAYKRQRRSFSRPRRYKKRRVTKKASRSRSRRRYGLASSGLMSAGSRSNYGFGDSKVVRCKWVGSEFLTVPASQQLTATAGTSVQLGSAYDPWTGITGQYNVTSAGFDLHSKIYNRYVVLGAKLVATFRPHIYNNGDIFDTPFKVGLKKNTTASLGGTTTWAQAMTDPDCRVKTLISTRARPASVTVSIGYSPRKEYGIKDIRDQLLTTTGVNAAVGASPSFGTFAVPFYQCIGKDNIINYEQTWTVEYKLYQKVMFYDRKDLSGLANADTLIQD